MRNKNFLQSIKCAGKGFCYAVKNERNLRFELFAGVMVSFFAVVYRLDRTQWAMLMLTIFSVLTAELINTGIEKAVDTATSEFSEDAMRSKDAGACAVTLISAGAAVVGIFLFGDIEKIFEAVLVIIHSMPMLMILCLLIILGIIFINKYKE